jgi:putative membrane protein insertion efficiency factor
VTALRRATAGLLAVPAWLLAGLIVGYRRFITPYTPRTCRFYPTCSSYGLTAVRTHGALKGTVLTAWRVLRCHPWSPGGVDHVPPHGRWRSQPEPDETAEHRGSAAAEPHPVTGSALPPPTGA